MLQHQTLRRRLTGAVMAGGIGVLLAMASAGPSAAMTPDQEAVAKRIIEELQPSTLSKDEQMKELEWFVKAAEP